MNIKHQEYNPREFSRQSEENKNYKPAESQGQNKEKPPTVLENQTSQHFEGET